MLGLGALALMMMLSVGCKKTLTVTDPPPGPNPENPLELVVSNEFDWKTTRDITLEVTGLSVPVNVRNTLQVKSVNEEKVYLKKQLFMNQDYTLLFTVPTYATEVLITYGSIRDTVELSTDVVSFNYLSN